MVIKRVLVSKYFTKGSFLEIKERLSGYESLQITDWKKDPTTSAIILRSKDLVDKNFIDLFPKLEIIASATSGFDHFNLNDLKNTPVKTCYSPEANVVSAAEISLFHILNFLKRGRLILKDPLLQRSPQILGEELSGKHISIIGLGRIGTKVSLALNALGCKVSAFDPYIDGQAFLKARASRVDLNTALQTGDIISLHCPLTKATKELINENTLKEVKPSALLINCARGELVSSKALMDALNKGRLHGACLDVLEIEPLKPDSPLLKLKNVTTSPHIGGFTVEAQKKSALEAAQQVKNWFEVEKPVLSSVPPDVAWKKDL